MFQQRHFEALAHVINDIRIELKHSIGLTPEQAEIASNIVTKEIMSLCSRHNTKFKPDFFLKYLEKLK